MHDPKFEKAVQEKMEELEFIPSESVWMNVERAVAPRRHRRVLAAFWWLLLPGLFLLAAGGAYYRHSAAVRDRMASSTGVASPAGVAAATPSRVAPGERPAADASSPAADAASRESGAAGQSDASATGSAGQVASGMTRGNRRPMNPFLTGRLPVDRTTAGTSNEAGTGLEAVTGIGAGADIAKPSASSPDLVREPYTYRPGLIGGMALSSGIKGPRLPSQPVSLAVTGLPTPKRAWRAGFAGGAGVSSFNSSLLQQLTVVSPASQTFATNNGARPLSINNAASTKEYTSDIRSDLSFWAGVFAQKPLSARWSFTLGLNLHYYSSSFRIGERVNNYVPVSASLITAAAVAPVQSYPYYSAGDDQAFTNRYYYLEIPATVQWQLTRSRILPLFWQGGVALSRLMASNALYYNDHSGVYFKDAGVINHTQLSVSSALLAALPLRGARVQAGPELQYGLTDLLHASAGTGHLFYGGFRVVVMP